jgi:ketol-acid reductoisomerase
MRSVKLTIYETPNFSKKIKKLLGEGEILNMLTHLSNVPEMGDLIP